MKQFKNISDILKKILFALGLAVIISTALFYITLFFSGDKNIPLTLRLDLYGLTAVALYYLGRYHSNRLKT